MTRGNDDAGHPNRQVGRERFTTVESDASFQARQEAFKNPSPGISDKEADEANRLLEGM